MTAMIPPKEEKQPSPSPSSPGSTTGVEVEMALIRDLPLPPRLPPGVYFSPTKQEILLTYLNRWIAGDAMPDAVGWLFEHDVYRETPDALARKYRPAITRTSERTEPNWWFLCHCKLQGTRGGRTRGERRVAMGGYWKLEQTTQAVRSCAVSGGQTLGVKRNFGFYLSDGKAKKEDERPKTWWLMDEFTSVACPEDGVARGDGKKVLPALYRMYLTPRDPAKKEKNKKRGRDDNDDGEDGAHLGDGPARLVVPAAYFDAVAALLPPRSRVLAVGQEQTKDAQEAPPEPGACDMYQGYDASPQDITEWQMMGRGDVLADSSWIEEHYPEKPDE